MTSRPLRIATIGSFLPGLAVFAGVRWEQVTHRAMLLCTLRSEKGSSPSRVDDHTIDGSAQHPAGPSRFDACDATSVGFAPAIPTREMGFDRMIRTRTAGQVAAMIPDRLCCCPWVFTEAATGLGSLARP
jgi:hypothetical protein